ncbi:PREDICTED: CASP8-associated protein 2 [Cyprinodon variegatus]|nr:PREDICTED: CASP8-associated protein 2 [Cyprinodon variegatus]
MVLSTAAPPCVDEESVDIYEGLDADLDSHPERPSSQSAELKDSMDLYEDLVAEEQLHRESSYTELQSRFEAAQKQIKELHTRLKQMEIQNTVLSTENNRLKKNISCLLRTARQEVVRKDAEIQRLTQGALGLHHHHRPQIKSTKDPNLSDRISTCSSSSRTQPPPPPPPIPQSKEKLPAVDAAQPSTKESCHFNRSINPSSHNRSKRQEASEKQTEPERNRSREKEDKQENHKLSESADRRLRNSHHNKDSEQKQVHKEDRDAGQGHASRSHRNKGQTEERHSRPEGATTSSQKYSAASSESRKEERKAQLSEKPRNVSLEGDKVTDNQPGRSSKSHRSDRWTDSKDKKSSSPDQPSKRCGDGTKGREKDRLEDPHRGVDRRCKDETRRRHRSRSGQREDKRERKKHRDKRSDKVDLSKEGRRDRNPKDAKSSSDQPNLETNISVDENNSNRKLCFMETLNLTLSPIKRHVLPRDGGPDDPAELDQAVGDGSAGENTQPNIEDMCVIDEVDNSEPEEGRAVEQSTEDPQAPSNQKISNTLDGKVGQENVEESSGKTPPVPTSSPQGRPQDPAQDPAQDEQTEPPLKAADHQKHSEQHPSVVSNSTIVEEGGQEEGGQEEGGQEVPESQQISDTPKDGEVHASEPEPTVDRPATEAAVVGSEETPEAAALPPPKDSEDVMEKTVTKDQQCGQAEISQEDPCLPSSTSRAEEDESPKDLESVSICLNSLPQEGLSLKDAIDIMTRTAVDTSDERTVTGPSSSSVSCIVASKAGGKAEENVSPEKPRTPAVTPKKICSQDPSGSVSLLHDEDSMMHTLNSLRRIPEAISPLRSPIQPAKRGVPHAHSKLGHVKSLQRDFSSTVTESNSKKLDVNKENKYPGPPANREEKNVVNMASEQTSSPFSTDLEEGEILSDSDEPNASSPVPAAKRAKLAEPVRNKPNSRKKPEERRVASKEDSAAVSTQSPRSRFKTVCPAASKASFSSVEEIMETFKLVRTEMRKKYMKLHKTFPKKSFYGVMDNFQKSFLEFVDGAQFGQICSNDQELKSKLKKLIASVFSKLLNNGIVKRIFEQQAANLKQKLWDFVDVQVDYLFIDIHTALKSVCQAARTPPEDKRSREGLESQQAAVKKQNTSHSPNPSLNRTKSSAVVPYRTGLGSRGKDIRMSHAEKDDTSNTAPQEGVKTQTPEDVHLPPPSDRSKACPVMIAPNGSMLDKPDFQLLTEQQASSLTFNLVRDSQMGEIFKCLLQGSDLLESTGVSADGTAWSIGTPRKDGERFLGFATPSKFPSPSKPDASPRLVATWSSISPRKRSSPCAKDHIHLNPALFDESCLLELPSGSRSLAAERTFSILAEDLAVSLTIPSPLKSDSHLSFLQPADISRPIVSTPDSVISAHISEDALLDGEDATEQDIHLALDNSSCSSRESTTSETPAPAFKPHVPMQALVMEKSNDHFIVKIRQINSAAETTLIAEESLSKTLIEEGQPSEEDAAASQERQNDSGRCMVPPSENQIHLTQSPEVRQPDSRSDTQEPAVAPVSHSSNQEPDTPSAKTPAEDGYNATSPSPHSGTVTDGERTQLRVEVTPPKAQHKASASMAFMDDANVSESERSLTIDTSSSSEKTTRGRDPLRKRKRGQDKLKAKRSRKEESQKEAHPTKNLSPSALSPSSLSAKNIVRKKGEVVMAWTRDEDRAILMSLKTKGASRETFSTLSEKLNKPSEQVSPSTLPPANLSPHCPGITQRS